MLPSPWTSTSITFINDKNTAESLCGIFIYVRSHSFTALKALYYRIRLA
ncbi:hypothetical protein PMEGAPL128_28250 [Priestia megaterium]